MKKARKMKKVRIRKKNTKNNKTEKNKTEKFLAFSFNQKIISSNLVCRNFT